jgi:predicted PurR-regulated permease PerM
MEQTRDDAPQQRRRERWWRSALFIVATAYVTLLLLQLLLQVLGGFAQIFLIVFTAWLLAFVLSPVVAWLVEHTRMSRGVAIGVVYAGTLVLSGALLFYAASSIGASIAEAASEFPQTRERIEGTLADWQRAIAAGPFQPDLVVLFRDTESTAQRVVASALGDAPALTVAILGALFLVIILSLYMLADSAGILDRLNRIVPQRFTDEAEILERTVSTAFGGFLRAQVVLTAIQTALTTAVVVLVGLPYGLLIVSASALAMLIPFFGPPLALLPPILATAIFKPEWLIIVAPLLFVAQTLLVNYFQPRLMRDALGMHPLLVLIGLLVGAQIAGLWGALFCIPILAVLNVFFTYFVNLRTIDEASDGELAEVIDEVQSEQPDAPKEEVVALAADRLAEETPEDEGSPASRA